MLGARPSISNDLRASMANIFKFDPLAGNLLVISVRQMIFFRTVINNEITIG